MQREAGREAGREAFDQHEKTEDERTLDADGRVDKVLSLIQTRRFWPQMGTWTLQRINLDLFNVEREREVFY